LAAETLGTANWGILLRKLGSVKGGNFQDMRDQLEPLRRKIHAAHNKVCKSTTRIGKLISSDPQQRGRDYEYQLAQANQSLEQWGAIYNALIEERKELKNAIARQAKTFLKEKEAQMDAVLAPTPDSLVGALIALAASQQQPPYISDEDILAELGELHYCAEWKVRSCFCYDFLEEF
jgi:hypothetical protein